MADNDFMTGYVAGQNEGGRGGGGFMDGNGSWVWILVIFALLFGWGGNGWNKGASCESGGGASMIYPYIGGMTTRTDISDGFTMQNITSGIQGIQRGICDSTYALNNAINNGFHGVDRGLCDLGYAIKDCCCQTKSAIDGVNYNMATQACETRQTIQNTTRDIIDNQNAGTRAILDYLTQNELATLRNENQALRFSASQAQQNAFITANQQAQTAELIRRLGADCPTPAYLVQPPTPVNFQTNCCGTVQFGNRGNNCGCGCGNGYAYAA